MPDAIEVGPSRATSALTVVAGLVLLALAVPSDAAGRLLLLLAGAAVLAGGVRDLVVRPVLRADAQGLRVVDGVRRRAIAWDQVVALSVVVDRRSRLLQVDLGDELLVLSRLRLGRPPADVLAELSALPQAPVHA